MKYNAALLVIPLIIASIAGKKKRPLFLLYGMIASAVSFFIVNPFALLDMPLFIKSVLHQGGAESYIGWAHHIRYSLMEGCGYFFVASGIAGCAIMCLRKKAKGIAYCPGL